MPPSDFARDPGTLSFAPIALAFLTLTAFSPGEADAAITKAIPGGYQASFDLAKGASFLATPRGADLFRLSRAGATGYSTETASISMAESTLTSAPWPRQVPPRWSAEERTRSQ